MKFFAPLVTAATALATRNAMPRLPVGRRIGFGSSSAQQAYNSFGRAYSGNEIVFAAIEMLATSAGEPHIIGRKWQRESPRIGRTADPTPGPMALVPSPRAHVVLRPGMSDGDIRAAIRNEEERMRVRGLTVRGVKEHMISNGFFRELPAHPLVTLLRKPNPWMSRGQLWGTVVMDQSLAGNSYLYKARIQDGPLKGSVAELWRLRPDRVKIIPSKTNFIESYDYGVGDDVVHYPPEDIIHFKTRNPFDDYYGMPPLLPASGRVNIDDFMKNFLRDFFEGGGAGPGAILTVKQKLDEPQKDDIRERKNALYGGPSGAHEWMILDNTESSFTKLGLDRGLRDALPQEIDALTETRIAMVFGIPGSILGLRIGYESSSYANKRQDWRVFWDLKMTPMLSDFDDVLNLQLLPDFKGIDEVLFDLSDIRALQEDVDAAQERIRKNVAGGLMAWGEGIESIGLDPDDVRGKVYFIPVGINPTKGEDVPNVALPGAPEDEPDEEPEEPTQIAARAYATLPPIAQVRHHCGALIARDMPAGADPELFCDDCRERFRPHDPTPPKVTVSELVRGENGRVSGSITREEVAT